MFGIFDLYKNYYCEITRPWRMCAMLNPALVPTPRLPEAVLFVLSYYWATNEEWKLGNDFWATFRQCLAP